MAPEPGDSGCGKETCGNSLQTAAAAVSTSTDLEPLEKKCCVASAESPRSVSDYVTFTVQNMKSDLHPFTESTTAHGSYGRGGEVTSSHYDRLQAVCEKGA
jgi:hypothetical protein